MVITLASQRIQLLKLHSEFISSCNEFSYTIIYLYYFYYILSALCTAFQLLMNLMFQFICFLTYGCLVENHFVKYISKRRSVRYRTPLCRNFLGLDQHALLGSLNFSFARMTESKSTFQQCIPF
jgi:hypothetical protein